MPTYSNYNWTPSNPFITINPQDSNFDGQYAINQTCTTSFPPYNVGDRVMGSGDFSDYSLITKPKKSMATKLGIMMKKLLDADTQTLVKAGFINGDLELTKEGEGALKSLAFDTYKAQLVVLAQAKLDEEKADKN